MRHRLPGRDPAVRSVALATIFALTISAGAWCQVFTGSLTGVVTDPSGAVVPGAKILLTDTDKGYTTNAITDSVGRYLFRNLAPSKYKIAATSAGFRP